MITATPNSSAGCWLKPKGGVWKAPDAAKAHGEKIYLACRDLRRELGQARVAMDGVIGTIPLDAMATRIGVRHGDRWARFCPPLGPLGVGDTPTTMAEDKRRILASYIICLQQALLKTEQIEAK